MSVLALTERKKILNMIFPNFLKWQFIVRVRNVVRNFLRPWHRASTNNPSYLSTLLSQTSYFQHWACSGGCSSVGNIEQKILDEGRRLNLILKPITAPLLSPNLGLVSQFECAFACLTKQVGPAI